MIVKQYFEKKYYPVVASTFRKFKFCTINLKMKGSGLKLMSLEIVSCQLKIFSNPAMQTVIVSLELRTTGSNFF